MIKLAEQTNSITTQGAASALEQLHRIVIHRDTLRRTTTHFLQAGQSLSDGNWHFGNSGSKSVAVGPLHQGQISHKFMHGMRA